MANFFWGQTELGLKHHWCSWRNLCYLVKEDGLGIQSFEDIQGAFSCKLWWRYYNLTSLWANFMLSRYSANNGAARRISRVWRRMLAVRDIVDHFTRDIDLGDKVQRAWVLTPSGDFTIFSAWDVLRPKRACHGSKKCVWSGRVPCNIAVFMWKLRNNYLSFPETLWRFGFQLSSKCQFCPDVESQDHVLSDCTLATESQLASFVACSSGGFISPQALSGEGVQSVAIASMLRAVEGQEHDNVRGGCCDAGTGNPGHSGAGEVLCDSDGNILYGFSSFLGARTNLEAKPWRY
ncbi:uncharacterized protein [Coffea arabica]|uniref:Reverse transcriptase zinc-binding domain-containing protein n=1 Tax=Coffea arabica TaxID=13443 RepID=A0ABM4W2Y3_COFAR